jgi:outer membrane autotransporter protein
MPEAVRKRLEEGETVGEAKPIRGVFATASYGSSDRAITKFQDGYQGDVSGLLGGFDREFGKWVAGFTVEYWREKGDFTGGGDFETTSVGPTGYASFAISDKSEIAFYVGLNSVTNKRVRDAQFTHVLSDGTEVIPTQKGTPAADFDANDSLAGGHYSYRIASGNLALIPKVALDWKQTKFGSYRETEAKDSGLALFFYDDKRTSLLATLGVDATVSISTNFGVVVVAEHLNYKHEFSDDQRSVTVSFVDDPRNQRFQFQTEPPDRDYLELGIDTIFLFQGGFQFFIGYQQLASHRYLDTGVVSAGIRKEF